jgi:hypothetical protein
MAFLHTLYHILFLFLHLGDFIELKCVKKKANEIVTNVLLGTKLTQSCQIMREKKIEIIICTQHALACHQNLTQFLNLFMPQI